MAGAAGGSAWRRLCDRYAEISETLARLGGRLGTEEAADELLCEQRLIVEDLAALQARSNAQIAVKMQVALDMIDPSTDELLHQLLAGILRDLRRQAND